MQPNRNLFDAYARDYLKELDHPFRRIVDAGGGYFIQAKARIILEFHRQYFNSNLDTVITDIGAGIGLFEKELSSYFKRIIGLDLSLEMLKVAGLTTTVQSQNFCQADALALPMPNNSTDIAFTSCVFHHIEPQFYLQAISEFVRVTRPGGLIMIFEHNPLNLLTQLVVHTTPLDRDAKLLGMRTARVLLNAFDVDLIQTGYFLYGPKRMDRMLYDRVHLLRRLPFGGQYFIAARVNV